MTNRQLGNTVNRQGMSTFCLKWLKKFVFIMYFLKYVDMCALMGRFMYLNTHKLEACSAALIL